VSIRKHWSVDASGMEGPARTVWELEQRINFGIGGPTIDREALKTHWDELEIDPWKRKALSLVIE